MTEKRDADQPKNAADLVRSKNCYECRQRNVSAFGVPKKLFIISSYNHCFLMQERFQTDTVKNYVRSKGS